MIQRQSSVLDQYDRPVPGAEIYVYDSTTNASAVLTSDGVTPLAQPIETDEFGVYTYWADTGIYREEIRYGGKLRYREAGIALGSPSPPTEAVLTRVAMAALTGMVTGNARRLSEAGREGTFQFDSSDLSAQVTADPQQGVYVPPASAPTGASGAWVRTPGISLWLNPEWFGLSATGAAAANTTAVNAALAFANSQSRRTVAIPAKTYQVNDTILAAGSGVTVIAHGAVVYGDMGTTAKALLRLTGASVNVKGGTWRGTSTSIIPWVFEVSGANCSIGEGALLEKSPDVGGYLGYVLAAATGFTMDGARTAGSNGIYNEASQASFLNSIFRAQAVGGDDGIAIKGIVGVTRAVKVANCFFAGFECGVGVGSEVGTAGANDSTYSKGVVGVEMLGNILYQCGSIAYIKPGGSDQDYRDGKVHSVGISNNILIDETGAKFKRGVIIQPGRGARVSKVYGEGNLIYARTIGGIGRLVGAFDLYFTADAGGTAAANVDGVFVGIDYTDPYNGVANGVVVNGVAAPGYPPTYIVSVDRGGAFGTVSNIVLDVRGSGSAQAGMVVAAGFASGAVRIETLDLVNVNQTNAVGQGGAVINSDVDVRGGYWSVVPAFGPELAGAANLLRETTALTGDVTGTASKIGGATSVAATIAANAVTYAKMQDVSAATRLLGRGSAAGAGDPQELTLGTLLKLAGTVLNRQMRGAMVKLNADLTAQDFSAGVTIAWNGTDVYDTDAIHDPVTNNTRLTSPTGSVYVRCGCTMTFANLTAGVDLTVAIRKNGATSYDGVAQICVDAASAAPCVNISTGPVPVTGGTDYFEVVVFTPTDTTVDLTAARSNFWMEVLE